MARLVRSVKGQLHIEVLYLHPARERLRPKRLNCQTEHLKKVQRSGLGRLRSAGANDSAADVSNRGVILPRDTQQVRQRLQFQETEREENSQSLREVGPKGNAMTEVQSSLGLAADPFSNITELVDKSGGCAVIDGGLAVQLEHYGEQHNNPLWTALSLITNPQVIRQVHWDYLEAGAQVILTASYQASLQGFESQGYSRAEGEDLLRKSVSLAIKARDQFWNEYQHRVGQGSDRPGRYSRALVAASIGSYGAYLADNSESHGEYGAEVTLEKLKEFHRRRLVILADAGPDVLALETIPSKFEAQALIEILEEEEIQVPAWISFNSKDGVNVVRGDPLKDCAELVDRSKKVVALGINCSPPSIISGLIRIAHQVTSKPIVVYPNRGANWDPVAKQWISSTGGSATDDDFVKYVEEWKQAGASLIGGCCQTTPATVRAIAGALHPDHGY